MEKPATTDYQNFENSSDEARFSLRQERMILQITQTLCEALAEAKITRSDLAKRMGKSQAFVSQILAGGRNLTLRTVADVLTAIECEVDVRVKSRGACKPFLRRFPVPWDAQTPFQVDDEAEVLDAEGAA